jgi:hypothetical protein
MTLNETYKGYHLQISTFQYEIEPGERHSLDPWGSEVRISWKESGEEKRELFRIDHSSSCAQGALELGMARAKFWADQWEKTQ